MPGVFIRCLKNQKKLKSNPTKKPTKSNPTEKPTVKPNPILLDD
jgi:hypothetical protein